MTYDALENVATITDAEGNETAFTYDTMGNVLTKRDGRNKTRRYTYNNIGQLLTVTDPESRTTTYTYDGSGNRIKETDPLSKEKNFTYDGVGQRGQIFNLDNWGVPGAWICNRWSSIYCPPNSQGITTHGSSIGGRKMTGPLTIKNHYSASMAVWKFCKLTPELTQNLNCFPFYRYDIKEYR